MYRCTVSIVGVVRLLDSQGIAVRFSTVLRDFSTTIRAHAGYGEHTHTHTNFQ